MEKALLIVSFGTTCPEALERDIVPVERAIQEALPEYVPLRAFGSGMIARKLRQRDGVVIPTVAEALEALRAQGVRELLVQPTFLLRGREYDMLMRQLGDAAQWFPCIRVGRPLLSAAEDYLALAAELARRFPREEGTLVLMGHGTEHHANAAYSILEAALCREGQNHILIGTVEGDPSLDTLCRRLLAEGVGRVRLMPLMLVAGDHAVNDMASEASGSWRNRLQAQGIEARCILRGLGSWEFVQKLYAAHALEAASSREGLDIPGKDDKLR